MICSFVFVFNIFDVITHNFFLNQYLHFVFIDYLLNGFQQGNVEKFPLEEKANIIMIHFSLSRKNEVSSTENMH